MGAPHACRLFFGDFDHFTAFVLTALGAGPVRELRLVAVRALGDSGVAQMVMRPAR